MRSKISNNTFDIAIGFAWLFIILAGLVYLFSNTASPSGTGSGTDMGADIAYKLSVLQSLKEVGGSVPENSVKQQVLKDVSNASDSRVVPIDAAQLSVDEKMEILKSLSDVH